MLLGKVTGSTVATRKHETYRRAKLLVVHPVDATGQLKGTKDYLALDPGFGAGIGDVVLIAREGAVVQQLMADKDVPANVVILGVVDAWTTEGLAVPAPL
jgi:microcompartment protein CcmK/EutM